MEMTTIFDNSYSALYRWGNVNENRYRKGYRVLDQSDRRTPVVLLAGFSGPAMTGVEHIAATLSADAGTVVVHHDLAELREGVVRRTVRTAGTVTTTVLELAHGCVSCTLRADLLPMLCTLAARAHVRRIVLALDPAIEAEALCHAIDTVEVPEWRTGSTVPRAATCGSRPP